jgi:hypothetical protein
MKKLLCAIYILCVLSGFAFGEEAEVIGENFFRYTQPLYFGFQTGDVEDKSAALGWGIGLEYGVTDWLNLQALWNPGFWGSVGRDNFGPFSDMFFGVKALLLGDNALIPILPFMRLSTALGLKMPVLPALYHPPEDSKEPDLRLWGSVLRAYCDLIPSKYFYFNFYVEGVYYPSQWSDNPAFKSDVVEHPLDLTGEIEARFEVPLEGRGSGLTLKGGAFGRYYYAPFMNSADKNVSDQYGLCAGGHFDLFFTNLANPVEISIGYTAPILGRNINPIHRVSLTFRVYCYQPLVNLKHYDDEDEKE